MLRATWCAAALSAVAAMAAFAENESAPDDPGMVPVTAIRPDEIPAGTVQLDEVVVTAQKRSESLQRTPLSISAFNADKLEQRGVQGIHDLALNVPGLNIEPFPTHNATLRIYIRGVGLTDAQLTQDPPVSVYMDGVYIARSVGLALELADLERIEVLRGPQGTLYGRNTTGGAINLITRRPQPGTFSATHKFGLGNRGALSGRSLFNWGLSESFAVKLALLANRKEGYVENSGPGEDFGDRHESAVRFDARWLAFEDFVADYGYEYADMAYVNQYFQAELRPQTNKGSAEVFKPYAESQTLYSRERLSALSSSPAMEESGTRIQGHTLTLTRNFGAQELKYLGGYRKLRDKEYADLGGGLGSQTYRLDSHAYDGPAADAANGGPTPLVIPTVKQSQWSHELQLSGQLFNDALEYVVGLYNFREEAVEDRHRLNHQLSTALSPDQLDELSASFPLELDPVLGDIGATALQEVDSVRLVNFVDFWWSIENRAKAVFGQATWTPGWLDQRLHLTLGYRRSDDTRRAVKFRRSDNYVELYNNGQGASPPEPLSSGELFDNVPAASRFKDDAWTTIAGFDWTPAVHLYAKSVEAYKSCGYNVRDPHINADSAGNTYGFGYVDGFAPERVQSYELGIKSEWWQRRLRLNADVFHSRYRDMQINFLIPGTVSDTKARNAGRARMRGLEVDLSLAATESLRLSADYAYLDADVLEVRDFDGSNVAHLFPFNYAPRHSGTVAVDWTALRSGWGELRAHLNYHFISERQGLVIAEERRGLTRIPAYGLYSGRLGLKNDSGWELALWGKNLADEVYPVMAIDNVPQADRAVVWGEPRSYGLDVIFRF